MTPRCVRCGTRRCTALPARVARGNCEQETTLSLWWTAIPGATGYKVVYRNFPADWATAKTIEVDGATTKTTLFDLEQQTTYQARLIVIVGQHESPPSVEASGDTLQSDCTPKKQKSGGCCIQ